MAVYYRDAELGDFFREYEGFIEDSLQKMKEFGQKYIDMASSYPQKGIMTKSDAFILPAVFLSTDTPTDKFPAIEDGRLVEEEKNRLGDYNYKKHLISLYLYNIFSENNLNLEWIKVNDNLIKAKIQKVLSHEFFHAIQHFCAPRRCAMYDLKKVNVTSQVMEATADFFAFLWLSDLQLNYMYKGIEKEIEEEREGLFKGWEKHLFSHWPYAGARHFVLDDEGYEITDTADLAKFDSKKSENRFEEVVNDYFRISAAAAKDKLLHRKLRSLTFITLGTTISFGHLQKKEMEWICIQMRKNKALMCCRNAAFRPQYRVTRDEVTEWNRYWYKEAFGPDEVQSIIASDTKDGRFIRVFELKEEEIRGLYPVRYLRNARPAIWICTKELPHLNRYTAGDIPFEKLSNGSGIANVVVDSGSRMAISRNSGDGYEILHAGDNYYELEEFEDYSLIGGELGCEFSFVLLVNERFPDGDREIQAKVHTKARVRDFDRYISMVNSIQQGLRGRDPEFIFLTRAIQNKANRTPCTIMHDKVERYNSDVRIREKINKTIEKHFTTLVSEFGLEWIGFSVGG